MLVRFKKPIFMDVILVCVVAIIVLIGLSNHYADKGTGELYVGISSESLAQTLPSVILKERPFSAAYYNHIQPPMFDSIRAVIAYFWNPSRGSLESFVDMGIYRFYVVLFGVLSSLLFVWMLKASGSRLFAWAGTLVWIIHPSSLSMSSFLDGTFLGSVLISWMIYEIWLFGVNYLTLLN